MAGVVMDAAIGWLVQNILSNLFTEKLEAWARRVGLADDVEKLKSDMRYVQMVLAAAKGRKIENMPLTQSLFYLKQQLYLAEDVMDELDYCSIQEQVTSGNIATPSMWSSSPIQQLGSALMDNLGNTIFMGDSRGKRKREDGNVIAACTHPINKSEISHRIKCIASKLRSVGCDVSDALKIDGSNFVGSSYPSQSTLQDTRLTSSYPVDPEVYGRSAEKESILKVMMSEGSNVVTVLPITGIGGVGKTTLAQLVYNSSEVGNHFDMKIWVCVSNNFDVLRLTREMLDCVTEQRQVETSNLNRLQEGLEKRLLYKRFLIVLDDVWDDMKEHSWNKLLAPLKNNKTMGNMILVTTRMLCVAETTQTVERIDLGALGWNNLWQLFQSCAYGDGKYEQYPSLHTLGKKIALGLRGNPLAAKTVGALLKRNMSIDNWTNILKNEEWKSLKDSDGIMPALKLSYDYLPDHLQQCFRYCCLFPKDYCFPGVELVRMWISQGFVHGSHSGKGLEDIGKIYLDELVNSGFFQKVEKDKYSSNFRWRPLSPLYSSDHFAMHDLMHDLAWTVSRAEFATVDHSKPVEILPSIRHLSIVINFACHDGNDHYCDNVEKNLLQVTSVRNLRSLVLIGHYKSCVFKYLQNVFKEALNLRLFYTITTIADFDFIVSNLVRPEHIRFIKVNVCDSGAVLPQALINFLHLQVLHVDSQAIPTLPSGVNNLVTLQHLVAKEEVYSTIASIGNMTALQELPIFKVKHACGFDIGQLKSMNQLAQLGIYQLENVRSKQEAMEARLIDKGNLENLCFSWDACAIDSRPSTATSTEVLEGLIPHRNIKHLQIIGYNGSNSPSWFTTGLSVASLQSLHLENCKEWRVLPPLENLPFLRKVKLVNMYEVVELAIPCLEELVLVELPRLEKCVANIRKQLNVCLQILIMEKCPQLKDFTPFQFQDFHSSEAEKNSWMSTLEGTSAELYAEDKQKGWLSGLCKLRIHGCPRLTVLPPVPPAADTQVSIVFEGLSTHPTIEKDDWSSYLNVRSSSELRMLDNKTLTFQHLKDIKSLHIEDCPNLVSISSEGIKNLLNLTKLKIVRCGNLVTSCIIQSAACEGWKATNYPSLPRLTHIKIESCGGIACNWLTEMLTVMQSLEKLSLKDCPQKISVSIDCPGQVAENSRKIQALDKFHLHIPLNAVATLKMLHIKRCPQMELSSTNEGFGGFTSLVRLKISDCPMLLSSVGERFSLPASIPELWIGCLPAKVQLYFPENQTSLKKLAVLRIPDLQSLCLNSFTSLLELNIYECGRLAVLEGLQCLSSLQRLELEMNPVLSAAWAHKCQEQEEGSIRTCLLPPSLVELGILDLHEEVMPYLLGAHLPSLSGLVVHNSPNLKSLQLGCLTALKYLKIDSCVSLTSLEGLQYLRNLVDLEIFHCYNITPYLELWSEQAGVLFPQLERLKIDDFCALTTSFCKHLTSLTYLRLGNSFSKQFGPSGSRLTDEQGGALQLLSSLHELQFVNSKNLVDLPSVLHRLPSLKKLVVRLCPCISRLPETGLPPSLELLEIYRCSAELTEQCKMLATEKLKVRINDDLVAVDVVTSVTRPPVLSQKLSFYLMEYALRHGLEKK